MKWNFLFLFFWRGWGIKETAGGHFVFVFFLAFFSSFDGVFFFFYLCARVLNLGRALIFLLRPAVSRGAVAARRRRRKSRSWRRRRRRRRLRVGRPSFFAGGTEFLPSFLFFLCMRRLGVSFLFTTKKKGSRSLFFLGLIWWQFDSDWEMDEKENLFFSSLFVLQR